MTRSNCLRAHRGGAWSMLSPQFSLRLSTGLIRGLFIVHRGLALLAFMLIIIHVIAVLYFVGV